MLRNLTFAVMLGLVVGTCGFGGIIGQQTSGTGGDTGGYYGFAFTTPGGGPWTNVAVNFFSDPASTTPVAQGNLFLFSAAYAGTPAGLAASAFLAESTGISGGQWIFSPSVTLQANTQYHFYSDTNFGANVFYGGAAIPAGVGYHTFTSDSPFGSSAPGANFLVAGDAVPEPGTFALLGLSLGVMAAFRRRSRT